MAEVSCVTCGQTGEAITAPLFLGKLEAEIKTKVCTGCWKKWEGMRVMVINEYQVRSIRQRLPKTIARRPANSAALTEEF
jgi:Fe-S cluster biosynthesis and repair protein YggX